MIAERSILVTNDDGIDSDALGPLMDALSEVGRVRMLVPDRNWSGGSHTITLSRPLRVNATRLRTGQDAHMTDGSPTDCVRLALLGFFRERPSVIVSGINRGANLGDDITYSGTVAAAMEGILAGLPSIAISLDYTGGDADYRAAAEFAALLARNILDRGFEPDALLNVNVPALPKERIEGVEVTRLGRRQYRDQMIERLDPFGTPYYWVGGPAVSEESEPGTDVHAVRAGKISVTPIHLDLTSPRLLTELATWDWGWTGPVEVSAETS